MTSDTWCSEDCGHCPSKPGWGVGGEEEGKGVITGFLGTGGWSECGGSCLIGLPCFI